MRYRRSGYRYATVVGTSHTWVVGDVWQSDRLRLLAQNRWRPGVDVYETATALEVVVDLAGVEENQVDVELYEDALVVEGDRRLSVPKDTETYHVASIRQGPFLLELPLPVTVDPDRVEARLDRGLLRVTLPKVARDR
jgi:HSP20 family protein